MNPLLAQSESVTLLPLGVLAVACAVLGMCVVLGLAALLLKEQTRRLGYALLVLLCSGALLISAEWIAWRQVTRAAEQREEQLAVLTSLKERPAEIPLDDSPGEASPESPDGGASELPEWVRKGSHRIGQDYFALAETEYCATELQCREALQEQILAVARNYLDTVLGPGAGTQVDLDLEYLRDEVLVEEYFHPLETSVGSGWQGYALLCFDPEAKSYLTGLYKASVLRERLYSLAYVGGIVLAILAVAYAYLKLDTATKGYYTNRLKFAALLLILTILGVGWYAR